MENDTTKIFCSNWVNQFLGERGFIGWVEPSDLTPAAISWGLDRWALDELYTALIALRADYRARKGHVLAGELIKVIRRDIRELEAERFRGYMRRPNRKATNELAAA